MKSESRYLKVSRVMFQIVKIISSLLGLAPCGIKVSTQSAHKIGFTFDFAYSSVGCAYNILLIMFSIGVISAAVPRLTDFSFPNNSTVVKTISISLALMGNILVIIITILYSIKQEDIIKIGKRLYEFDQHYDNKLIGRRENLTRDFKKLMTIILMLFIWIGMIVSTIIGGDGAYLIASGLRSLTCSWILVQYGLVINVLEDRFEGLNNALSDIARHPTVLGEDSLFRENMWNRSIVNNLVIIKRARNAIYKVSRQVSKFYSFPVLIVISFNCCCCVNSVYFCIMTLLYPRDDCHIASAIDSVFWTILVLYPIMVLSASVNTFKLEVCMRLSEYSSKPLFNQIINNFRRIERQTLFMILWRFMRQSTTLCQS